MLSGTVSGTDTGTGSAVANGLLEPTKRERVEKLLVGSYDLSVETKRLLYFLIKHLGVYFISVSVEGVFNQGGCLLIIGVA